MTGAAPDDGTVRAASPTTPARSIPRAGDLDPDTVDPTVSIVVPAFDEAGNMPELFSELAATFRAHALHAEVVLVDDGSTDGTAEAARRAADGAGVERLTLLRHRRNRGKTEALLTAAGAARGRYLVLFDADLQHSTEEIPRFVERLEAGLDLVTGRKIGDYDKRVVSGIYNWLARSIFRVPVRDMNAMKALRAEVLDRLTLRHDWHRYLVVLAHAEGFRIGEIDVELHPRRHGRPKYSGRWRIVIGMLDLISVWFQLVFARKPMLFFGVTGLALLIAGAITGLVALVLRFGFGQGFRPLLTLVTLLVVSGLLLFVLGFLAEMIAGLRGEVEALKSERRELVRKGREPGRGENG